ncbi:aminotransferase class V-fold PLP-dependent enzyme [Noviherbaspirillum cavernae]|uniref:cysteine desulfurase n=1 Tax=Noviherbaspirillum cavernae TaxID=2320862 RepID=A0A418WVW1_9BURK|nr:aminotransferase class V-fold PLP-dependent enzyme [Noviherbaspirillum cavernae]RJF96830.1 aminotransferase class V-fold PLP-dependent enzyme [Noviherbaspirillum cavernae]
MNAHLDEIYLDANATTPVLPQAIEAASRVMREGFGNPSSTHGTGLRANALLQDVRDRATRVLGAEHGRVLFTSGATEAIQTAVLSALCDLRERGEHAGRLLLYGATEHKAVPASLAHWNSVLGLGCRIEAIPVDANGRHDLAFLRTHAPHASLVCTMAANNETGVISDLRGIEDALAACAVKPLWLVDGVQALGKLALNLAHTRIDYAAFSGHKLYAPKGIGLLYLRNGAPYTPLLAGGGQESGLRSGTENMSGIAALGAVLEALEQRDAFREHAALHAFREQLIAALRDALPELAFNTPLDLAVPTTLNFSVPGFTAKELLDLFDAAGVRVGTGSACNSSKASPSHVLLAMGIPAARAASAIRLSFGPAATLHDIAAACERIRACGAALRRSCRLPSANADTAPQHGLTQLVADQACTWLLADAASRSCVIIDPVPQLSARLEAYVRCQNHRVLAILDTRAHAPHESARAALAATLADCMAAGNVDAFGWPAGHRTVTLADGERAEALTLGGIVLARTTLPGHAADSLAYLAGTPDADERLPADAVRYAFTGDAILHGAPERAGAVHAALHKLTATIGDDSLLCPAHDVHNRFVTTLAAERDAHSPHARTPQSGDTLITDKTDAGSEQSNEPIHDAPPDRRSSINIAPDALRGFLREQPDALLVDVREACEHSFSDLPVVDTRILNIPLSRFAEGVGQWLGGSEQRPLVFFCRSGNRGMAAATSLRRLGYAKAWNLAGGVALKATA